MLLLKWLTFVTFSKTSSNTVSTNGAGHEFGWQVNVGGSKTPRVQDKSTTEGVWPGKHKAKQVLPEGMVGTAKQFGGEYGVDAESLGDDGRGRVIFVSAIPKVSLVLVLLALVTLGLRVRLVQPFVAYLSPLLPLRLVPLCQSRQSSVLDESESSTLRTSSTSGSPGGYSPLLTFLGVMQGFGMQVNIGGSSVPLTQRSKGVGVA